MLFGTRTYGEAVRYGGVFSNSARSSEYSYTVISFKAGDAVIEMKGPEDVIYDIGEKIKIIYNKNNPEKCMIPSLVYFYTMPNVLLPAVLLLVWIAFYTSFKPPKS